MIRFRFLSGDDKYYRFGECRWISKRLNNSEFDYWLVIPFIWMADPDRLGSEAPAPYHVSICAVAPSLVTEGDLRRALAAHGLDLDFLDTFQGRERMELAVDFLHDHGIAAFLWARWGNNADELMRAARGEAQVIDPLFGFYMDRPENLIGTTGWDMICGDLMAPIRRLKESA